MKKLIILLFLFAGAASAQIDSSLVKINASIQARDVELIAGLLPYSEEYEDSYDAAKVKFRVQTPPTGTTNVSIDSVTVGTWLNIWLVLKRNPYAIGASADSRIETVLRAKNNAWLTGKINALIVDGTNYYNHLKDLGRKRLTGK